MHKVFFIKTVYLTGLLQIRWNTTFVPNFRIGAQDYLFAKQYYVPLAGVSVKTERSAVIRPKLLPYWGAIQQLGWGISDFEGYMRSIFWLSDYDSIYSYNGTTDVTSYV